MDLVGIDVNLAAARGIWEAFRYEPRFRPSPIQERLVEAGRLGRKTGEGFYWYGEDGRRIGPAGAFVVDPALVTEDPLDPPIERIVVAIANEAYRALGEGVAHRLGHRSRPAPGRRSPPRPVRGGRAVGRRRSGARGAPPDRGPGARHATGSSRRRCSWRRPPAADSTTGGARRRRVLRSCRIMGVPRRPPSLRVTPGEARDPANRPGSPVAPRPARRSAPDRRRVCCVVGCGTSSASLRRVGRGPAGSAAAPSADIGGRDVIASPRHRSPPPTAPSRRSRPTPCPSSRPFSRPRSPGSTSSG